MSVKVGLNFERKEQIDVKTWLGFYQLRKFFSFGSLATLEIVRVQYFLGEFHRAAIGAKRANHRIRRTDRQNNL